MMEEYLYSIDRVEQTLRIENITLTVFSHVGIFQEEPPENARLRQMVLHEHTHWEMFGGVYGHLKVEFADHSCILDPGDVIIIRPHVLHNTMRLTADSQRSSVPFYYIRNTNTFVHDLYKSLTDFMGEQPYLLIRNRPDICQVIQRVMEAGINHTTLLACMLTAEILFLLLSRKLQENNDAFQILENSEIGRLEKLDQILNVCYLRPVPLKYVAEKLFISERQLERIVKSRYGAPYREIVLERRMRAAEQLLAKTNLTVQEISVKIGFHTKESFITAFRKKTGFTPNEYRNRV